jgi:hypothetical protein
MSLWQTGQIQLVLRSLYIRHALHTLSPQSRQIAPLFTMSPNSARQRAQARPPQLLSHGPAPGPGRGAPLRLRSSNSVLSNL